jgi:hypothetical protein
VIIIDTAGGAKLERGWGWVGMGEGLGVKWVKFYVDLCYVPGNLVPKHCSIFEHFTETKTSEQSYENDMIE